MITQMTFVISEEENASRRMEMCLYHKELVRWGGTARNTVKISVLQERSISIRLWQNWESIKETQHVSQRTLKEEMKVMDVTAVRVLLKTIMR